MAGWPPIRPHCVPGEAPLSSPCPQQLLAGPRLRAQLGASLAESMRENRLKVQPLFSPGRRICSIPSVKRNLLSAPKPHNGTSPQLAIKRMPLALASHCPWHPLSSAKGHSDHKLEPQALLAVSLVSSEVWLGHPPLPSLHQHLPVIVHTLITSVWMSLQPGRRSPVPGASSIDQRTSCFKCLEI